MAERRRGLGRGLGALIPSAPTETPREVSTEAQDHGSEASERSGTPVLREASVAIDASSGSPVNSRQTVNAEPRSMERPTPAVDAVANEASNSTPGPQSSRKQPTTGPKKGKKKASSSAKASKSSAETAAKVSPAETEDTVSRETPKSRKRTVSAEARQKAMKARMDMGVAARNSATQRPSDMFFTPGPSGTNAGEQAVTESPENVVSDWSVETPPETVDSRGVSRETATAPMSSESVPDPSDVIAAPDGASGADTGAVGVEPDTAAELQLVPGASFAELNVKDIHPNRKQPRQVFDEDELAELAYSIGELGVLQPVVVRVSRETEGPKYELVMGERRWRATQRAGLETIPAIVRETSDDDLLRDALLENLHRSQLNPLEEAAAYQQLLEEFGASQEELSRRIGRSRPQISNTLRLLRLPALVQRRVAAGVLSAGHARALLSLEDPAEMERLAQRIVAEGLSVRATEEAVTLNKSRKPAVRRSAATQERHRERLDYIADAFSDKLDTTVKINLGARKGRMMIEFASVADLNRIISVLDPQGLPENQD